MSGRFSNVNAILVVGHSGNEKVYHQHHIPCKIETTLYARRERYAKQLRVLTFNQYEEVIRQLDGDKGFDDFLVSLMRVELENRQESNRKRKIRSAHFPYTKILEEFDLSYLEHISEAQIHQLASCNFIQKKQNIVLIGNPGTGKTHLSIALGLKARILHEFQSPIGLSLPLSLIAQLRAESGKQIQYQWQRNSLTFTLRYLSSYFSLFSLPILLNSPYIF